MTITASINLDSNIQNTLSWSSNTTFDGGYHIERSLDSGSTWASLDYVSSGTFIYPDSGINNATYDYDYRVSGLPRGTGVCGTQSPGQIFVSSPGINLFSSLNSESFLGLDLSASYFGGSGGRCDLVPYWTDSLGGRNFVQDTPSRTPVRGFGYDVQASGNGGNCGGSGIGGTGLNSKPYLTFNGIADELTAPNIGIESGTMFFVIRPNSLASGVHMNLFAHPSGGGALSGDLAFSPVGGSPGLSIWDGAAWNTLIPAGNLTTTNFQIITVDIDEVNNARGFVGTTEYNSASAAFEFDGTTDMTIGGRGTGAIAGEFFEGEIGGIAVLQPLTDDFITLAQQRLLSVYL